MSFLHKTQAIGRMTAGGVLNTLFPPRCYACGDMTGRTASLCSACWQKLEFITDPLCDCCGAPFPYAMGEQARCMDCLEKAPAYTKARSVFLYTDDSRRLITGYKYHDRTQATPMYAEWLARIAQPFVAEADYILPVPLHRSRLVSRRYNQAALLTQTLAQKTGVRALPDGLLRTRPTPAQAGLNRKARLKNVKDAFAVNPKYKAHVLGKKVLLVDDVMTTGATLEACAKALRKSKVGAVYVLTLARTPVGEV